MARDGDNEGNHHNTIQEEHVRRALKADKGESAELLKWSAEDFTNSGDHYISNVTRVTVSYLLKGKQDLESYVVKMRFDECPDIVKPLFRSCFQKEVGFYRHIVPLLNAELIAVGLEALHFPKYHCSFLDDESGLIFLEDLRPRGFKMADKWKGMDVTHATLVFEELARLHAASKLLESKTSFQELTEEYDFLNLDLHKYPGPCSENFQKLFENAFATVAEILRRNGGNEKGEEWLRANETALGDVVERNLCRREPFAVICHGDCWNNNMLFRYDGKGIPVEVMMVDLQFSRVASLATDLRYMAAFNLTPEVRRNSLESLLASYHDSFRSVMNAAARRSVSFSLRQLKREYEARYEWARLFLMIPLSYVTRPFDYPSDAERRSKSLATKIEENLRRMKVVPPRYIPSILDVFGEVV
ncbi:uncharacterized protein [Macrobrachium rosenbergii]|uniref:uncharacterized protein n=1 Tax=Macrobrachium rosenbergii TaxID=79674 RepID=UPI0034D46069